MHMRGKSVGCNAPCRARRRAPVPLAEHGRTTYGHGHTPCSMSCSEDCTPAPLGERGLEGEVEVVELALQRRGVAPRRRALERLRPGFGRGQGSGQGQGKGGVLVEARVAATLSAASSSKGSPSTSSCRAALRTWLGLGSG